MKTLVYLALASACLYSPAALAQKQFLRGEGVFVDGIQGVCVIATGRANMQGQYEVRCGSESLLVAREAIRSNPDQSQTSRNMVCPGGSDPCYFE